MKQRSPKSSPQNCKRLIVLTLISVFVVTSVTGVDRTFAIQQGETELIAQANAAIAKAQRALNRAEQKRLEGEERLAQLVEFTNLKDPDINSLTNLGRLTQTVSLMFDAGAAKKTLQEQLLDEQTKLAEPLTDLTAAKNKLDAATSTPAIEAAKTAVKANIDTINARVKTPQLNGLKAKLDEALSNIYTAVGKLANTANNQLKPFTSTTTPPADLLALFRDQVDLIPLLIQFDLDLQADWPILSAQLKNVVTDHATKVAPADAAVSALHTSVGTVVNLLSAHIKRFSTFAQGKRTDLTVKEEAFKDNPALNEGQAVGAIQDAQRTADALAKINRTVEAIREQAKAAGFPFDEGATTAAHDALSVDLVDVRTEANKFQSILAGDRSLWITEKIRLYYFTDIPRLIKTLNPAADLRGGDEGARNRAKNRLELLRAAEDEQSLANGRVSGLKSKVRELEAQLEQANAQLDLANILAQRTARTDAELNRRPAADVSAERKARSAEEKDAAERNRVAAQARADRLNDEQSGLTAQLQQAQADLEIAQAAFERAANATIRAAQAESAAFAEARDNAPFWYVPGVATDSDPAKRVEISSSTGGDNAIFVRGRREDVVKVQDIIAKLDEPAPQARMTLWKIELNSDATEKGAEKFNEALRIVEDELAQTRAKIADTLSALLGAVSEEAERAAYSNGGHQFIRRDCNEKLLYANTFPVGTPTPALLLNRGISPENTDITGRNQRLKRYALYSDEVQSELGIRFIDELGFDNPKQFGLKDPGSATTLNEALIILLLTDRDHRDAILRQFLDDARAKLGKKDPKQNTDYDFTRLYSMLGFNTTSIAAAKTQTTRQQQELIYAIRGPLLRHLVGRIARLQDRVDQFRSLDDRINRPAQTGSLLSTPVSDGDIALHQCLKEKLPLIFDTIHDEFPISPLDIMEGRVKLIDPGEGTIGLQPMNGGRAYGPPKIYNLRPSPARVAAADGMLDIYTKAFEDDIDREFVQPMLLNLRKRLKKSGIGFGVIQRTSMLATNRLVARVDPRATAELSVGEETNLLHGLQSIAQLTLASQTGGLLGGLGQLRASAASEKDAAEIYGITSGSAFQVTPIFDPTGQALRFKFDFVDTTLVREPRGTTNPRLPRIERHTVNTEVQLANLEIREVSRFESDSKVGLPTTYWGGLPIVKDIPGVRPIPLIGWFVRRKGSNAIAQRSLIFAQTTMSPTIGDILNLFDTSLQRR